MAFSWTPIRYQDLNRVVEIRTRNNFIIFYIHIYIYIYIYIYIHIWTIRLHKNVIAVLDNRFSKTFSLSLDWRFSVLEEGLYHYTFRFIVDIHRGVSARFLGPVFSSHSLVLYPTLFLCGSRPHGWSSVSRASPLTTVVESIWSSSIDATDEAPARPRRTCRMEDPRLRVDFSSASPVRTNRRQSSLL